MYLYHAMAGSAAASINGVTLHSATCIENKRYKINDIRRQEWMAVNFLVIDEISYAKQMTLEELDKSIKK